MTEHELNETVATEVMDFERQTFKGQNGFGTPDSLIFFSHFNPSQDISDAWKVINKLKDKQVLFRMTNKRSGYVVEMWHEVKSPHVTCEEETAERAICIAALRINTMLNSEGNESDPWIALSI